MSSNLQKWTQSSHKFQPKCRKRSKLSVKFGLNIKVGCSTGTRGVEMKTVRGDIILWKPISSSEQRYLGVINKLEDMKSDRYYMKTAVNHYQETLDLSFLSLTQFSPLMAICQTPWPLSSSHSVIHHLFQYLSTVTHTHTHTHTASHA